MSCPQQPNLSTEQILSCAAATPRSSFLMANSVLCAPVDMDAIPPSPSTIIYPGRNNFTVLLQNTTEKPPKSIAWTYSEKLTKLFCQAGTPVPIKFKYDGEL